MIQVAGGIDNTNQRYWLELVKRMLWDVCIYVSMWFLLVLGGMDAEYPSQGTSSAKAPRYGVHTYIHASEGRFGAFRNTAESASKYGKWRRFDWVRSHVRHQLTKHRFFLSLLANFFFSFSVNKKDTHFEPTHSSIQLPPTLLILYIAFHKSLGCL